MNNIQIFDIDFVKTKRFPYWNKISPKQILLSRFVKRKKTGKTLLLGCGNGALAVFLARQEPQNQLFLHSINSLTLKATRKTLQLNNITDAKIIPDINPIPKYKKVFDSVLLAIDFSRGRNFYRRMLLEGYNALKNDGRLYLAGANKSGVKSAIKDANELLGNMKVLGYKSGNRIAKGVKDEQKKTKPAWTTEPGVALNSWYKFTVKLAGNKYHFSTLPGVFSYQKVDEGTETLLENIRGFSNKNILDWGCGYGIIGIYLAKMGAKHVDMVDINRLAVAATRENLVKNEINNADVYLTTNHELNKERKYGLIVSNPPFHLGKKVNYQATKQFFKQVKNRLNNNGKVIVVANQFIPYEKELEKYFSRTRIVFKNNKYKVIEAS